jgi:hypothetical protein
MYTCGCIYTHVVAARVRSPARLEQLWSSLKDCCDRWEGRSSKNVIITTTHTTTTATHTLLRYRQGMEGQHRRICEILQEMTELVVWGDQNASRANANVNSSANGVVDMFLEKNRRGDRILTDCIQLLKMCGRDSGAREIKRQLLQTFNMLIQNINNDHVINLIMANYMRCGM